jgi:FixJ family two-component response regulator
MLSVLSLCPEKPVKSVSMESLIRSGGGGMPQKAFTIYVVDDDESIRRALKRLLRSVGHHAVTFGSAEEFMDSAPEGGEGCLVLDIRLPGMTGLDLHEKLTASGAKYAVIFMTARDNPQWQQKAKMAGAVAYLRKPFDEQSLLDAIQLARRKGSRSGMEEMGTP